MGGIMGIDIERLKVDPAYWDENAPEGATHRSAKTGAWFQIINGSVWEWIDDGWMPKELIPRPTKPEPQAWDGEGYPPIGCDCEVWFDDGVQCWHKARVLCEHSIENKLMAVVLEHEPHENKLMWVDKFRRILTPEEKRRDELATLCRAKFNQLSSSSNYHLWTQIADAIIAAGWRKGD
jgi:hypothetical protein